MLRKIAVPVFAAAVLLGGGGVALAQPAPKPIPRPVSGTGSVLCLTATADVVIAARKASFVVSHAPKLPTPAQLQAVAAKLADLEKAKSDQAAYTGLDLDILKDLNAAVVKAQNAYNDVVEIAAHPTDNDAAVVKARANLQAAIDAQRKACDARPVVVTPTSTQAPTSTPAPTSTQTSTATATATSTATATTAPATEGSDPGVVTRIPSGSIDTGWA